MSDNLPPTRTKDLKTTKLLVIHDPFGSIADFDKAGFLSRVLQQYRVLSKEFELIYILTCDSKKWDIFPPNVHHVPFFDIPFRKILFIFFSGILRLKQVDIVEVDGPLAILPSLPFKFLGAKILFYHRWNFAMSVRDVKGFPYTVLANLVQKIAFKVADVIAATTQELADDARKNCRCKNVYLLPNYVDIEQFKPLSGIKRPNLLVFVGRLHKQKNIRLLMDAMQHLPQYKLWIIGDGPLKKPLFILKERSELNNVEFFGKIENNVLPLYLNQAEVFILLSPREGHPKALLEAMACGLPCIGANSSGIRDIIIPGETGLICEPTVESVVNTIKKIFSNRKEMFKMGKNAMEFVRSEYSVDSILRYKIEIYCEVLGTYYTHI